MPSIRGSETVACGRARAIASTTNAATTQAAASRSGRVRAAGAAVPRRRRARARRGPPAAPAAVASIRRATSTPSGTSTSASRAAGHRKRHAGIRRRRLRPAAIRTIARTRSSSVDRVAASTRARRNAARELGLAGVGRRPEPLPEPGIGRVDVELLAGLGVLHDDRPDVRQLDLAGVDEPDREHLVAPVEELERPLPAGHADEVRDDDDAATGAGSGDGPPRAAAPRSVTGATGELRLGAGGPRPGAGPGPGPSRPERRDPRCRPRTSRRPGCPRRVRSRASVATKSISTVRFSRSVVDRPEVDRRAEVEQEPGGDLAVLVVLADVRRRPSGP